MGAALKRLIIICAMLLAGCATTQSDYDLWMRDQKALSQSMGRELEGLRKLAYGPRVKAPFLWRVSRGKQSSWLLGTIHNGVSLGSLPVFVRNQALDSTTVVLEADADQILKKLGVGKDPSEAMRKLLGWPADTPLDQVISKKAWRNLCWDLHGIPPDFLRQLSPQGASMLYSVLRAEILMPPGKECLDCEIGALALEKKIPEVFLEELPADVDFERFFTAGTQDGASLTRMLTSDTVKTIRDETAAKYGLLAAYKTGALETIEEIVGNTDDYDTTVAKRNKAWMPRLDAVLAKGGAFVAVGVGHMTGKSSLIKLLEAKGYSVTRWTP